MNKLTDILSNNGIVIMPCDTIYGIVGVYPDSENRIRDIKGRDENKPFLILIRKEWISRFTKIELKKYFLDLWPGPLTLIVPGLTGNTVALRVPDDKRLQNILLQLNHALYSTSVNRSGKASLENESDIEKEFGSEVELFVKEGDLTGSQPSTIINLTVKPYKIIRQGSCIIDTDMLL
ncbi:MAG: L-threonylcarbamoyladenylate synthase [Spirochaetales bacterium]|nr:L-threonylcarbamoyladenylate synthase [Spirochaetales bacterium]